MAFTLGDFDKIWASTSPLTPYEFSDSNYQQGWNFIGATPPARQMWDFLQKRNDEKTQWLYNNKLSLSGGTMTGEITFSTGNKRILTEGYSSYIGICSGESGYSGGGNVYLFGKDYSDSSTAGCFSLAANDGNNTKELLGKPDGTLNWGGKAVIVGTEYSESFTVSSINAGTAAKVGMLAHTPKYFTVLYNSGSNWATTTVGISTAGAIWMKSNHTSTLTDIKFTVNYIS